LLLLLAQLLKLGDRVLELLSQRDVPHVEVHATGTVLVQNNHPESRRVLNERNEIFVVSPLHVGPVDGQDHVACVVKRKKEEEKSTQVFLQQNRAST
jgi:hypothetical protein